MFSCLINDHFDPREKITFDLDRQEIMGSELLNDDGNQSEMLIIKVKTRKHKKIYGKAFKYVQILIKQSRNSSIKRIEEENINKDKSEIDKN